MSMRFLQGLNGNRAPAFSQFLAGLDREPNICWYPSAGNDFRDLLYLSRAYAAHDPAIGPEVDPPDLFVHTDYYPWDRSSFLDHPVVHIDTRTVIRVKTIEEVAGFPLPRHPDLVHFPEPNAASGRVLYLRLSVHSDRFGALADAHVLYAFVENAAFCAEVLIPQGARLSHLVHVRYGGGCGGGGSAGGAWLSGVIGRLGIRTLITDGRLGHWQDGDHAALRLYPALSGPDRPPPGRVIRTVPSVSWSGHGDVSWVRLGDGS
jgi:hypothetical protein